MSTPYEMFDCGYLMYCDTMCLGVSLRESEIRQSYRWP